LARGSDVIYGESLFLTLVIDLWLAKTGLGLINSLFLGCTVNFLLASFTNDIQGLLTWLRSLIERLDPLP
jgi:hypothetical protein